MITLLKMNKDALIYEEYLQKMKELDEGYDFLRKELWLEWIEEKYEKDLENEIKKENRKNAVFSFILWALIVLWIIVII